MRSIFKRVAPDEANAAVYEHCSSCGKPIREGETYWSVQYARKVFDGSSVDVQDAVVAAYFCAACARQRDFSKIQVPVKQ